MTIDPDLNKLLHQILDLIIVAVCAHYRATSKAQTLAVTVQRTPKNGEQRPTKGETLPTPRPTVAT